jgi:hypothetical protein
MSISILNRNAGARKIMKILIESNSSESLLLTAALTDAFCLELLPICNFLFARKKYIRPI